MSGIGRASALLASGTVVSRVLGFVKAIVIADAIGNVASVSADAYAVSTAVPNSIYAIIGGGLLSAILVPQIVRASTAPDGGNAYVNKLVTLGLTGFLLVATLATLAAPLLVRLFATDKLDLGLATAFAFWSLPQVFFLGMYALLGEVLNARKAFGPFTWAPVANNLVGIASVLTFVAVFGADADRTGSDWTPGMIALFAGGGTLGLAAQAILLFFFWRRVGLRFRPDFAWRGVGLGHVGRAAGWTFGMLVAGQIAGIIQTNVATLGTAEGAGPAALGNAWLIFMLPHSVITVSLVTAFYTRMSEHATHGDTPALKSDISIAMRSVTLAMVLATAVLVVVSLPFARVFNTPFAEVQIMAAVITAYVIGLVPFCLLFVVQRSFYALADTRTPFAFTMAQVVVVITGVLLSGLLPAEWIGVGIATAVSVAGTLQLLLASWLLARRIGRGAARGVGRSLLIDLGAVVPAGAVGAALLFLLGGTVEDGFALSGKLPAILSLAAIAAAMTSVYGGALVLLRSPDLMPVLARIIARLKRG
ncbi:murein biosynthesis integral membrane protein MurJ [Naasia sp. SYSU D00057]|uniref:murein biosynthesis integral membrane protein MurJ n=1 Tax=Naasia sp. SYSU D00057 TaxID=2817380 RepID=UPI001B312F2A|nr:murein biosynthesis integral membrane protein MurJ [Naasia sp. SYSU D00057]